MDQQRYTFIIIGKNETIFHSFSLNLTKPLYSKKKVSKTQKISIYRAEVNVFKVELDICWESMGCMV